MFAKLVNDIWIIADGKSRKYDKLFLTKTFVDSIPEINEDKIIINDGIEAVPDIINLEDSEKFKDLDNNIIKIETRGERKVDKIYFKVKDIILAFQTDNLNNTIIDKRSSYEENIHYKYFNCKRKGLPSNITIKRELFVTYEGILKVLFASLSPKVKPFIKWTTIMHIYFSIS